MARGSTEPARGRLGARGSDTTGGKQAWGSPPGRPAALASQSGLASRLRIPWPWAGHSHPQSESSTISNTRRIHHHAVASWWFKLSPAQGALTQGAPSPPFRSCWGLGARQAVRHSSPFTVRRQCSQVVPGGPGAAGWGLGGARPPLGPPCPGSGKLRTGRRANGSARLGSAAVRVCSVARRAASARGACSRVVGRDGS